MPIKQYREYLVRFSLPDGDHLATMNGLDVIGGTDDEKKWLVYQAKNALSTNPDAKIVDIEPLQGLEHLQEAVVKLREQNPDRPLATDLGLDTPNRILHDIEIPRGLAAMRVPGGTNLNVPGIRTAAARPGELPEHPALEEPPGGSAPGSSPPSNVPG